MLPVTSYSNLLTAVRLVVIALAGSVFLSGCSFNKLYYYPDRNAVDKAELGEDIYINWDKKDSLHGIFYAVDKPKASIYFLHGNAGNLSGWKNAAIKFWKEGYNVFIIDFPGFGNSSGKTRHSNVIKAAQSGLNYFIDREDVRNTKKVLMGMSLGGNLSVKIGTDNQDNLDAMVLEGPFNSHRKVGLSRVPKILWPIAAPMVRNKIKGEKLIKRWTKPLLVIHSEEDEICPYWMGKQLYQNSPSETKELWTIQGSHLAGMAKYEDEYYQKLEELVNSLK